MDYVWMVIGLVWLFVSWLWDHRDIIEIFLLCVLAYFGGRSVEKYFAELRADVKAIKKSLDAK